MGDRWSQVDEGQIQPRKPEQACHAHNVAATGSGWIDGNMTPLKKVPMTEMEMLTRDRDEALTEIEVLNREYDEMELRLTGEWDACRRNLDEVAEDYNRLSDKYTDLYNQRWRAENILFFSVALNIILVAIIIQL